MKVNLKRRIKRLDVTYITFFQLAALLIFVMAIAYLKHPESHITQLNLNNAQMNVTVENVERDEKITQVVQKASLSK